MEETPFGGTPGQGSRNLASKVLPEEGYRLIPGIVWWKLVHWGWRRHLAAMRERLYLYQAPFIASPSGVGLHLTDKTSLQGLVYPEDFAYRLTLLGNALTECKYEGCAVIRFNVPNARVLRQGSTDGGAREWLLDTNIRLNDQMQVTYIDVSRKRPRYFPVTL